MICAGAACGSKGESNNNNCHIFKNSRRYARENYFFIIFTETLCIYHWMHLRYEKIEGWLRIPSLELIVLISGYWLYQISFFR